MQKFFTLCAALFVGAATLFAQHRYNPTGQYSISVQGGPMLSINENSFSYKDFGYRNELITSQASVSFSYDFTKAFALRANVGYAKNMGACNTKQTSGHGFYPYSFKSINYFVDAILQMNYLNDSKSPFCPKLYCGLGGGHTFGFNEVPFSPYKKTSANFKRFHPWQNVNERNDVVAFRLGFIAEYNFQNGLGIFADLSGEAYTDNYNGLMPKAEDFDAYQGYAGFPFDLRGLLSLGLVYHFR